MEGTIIRTLNFEFSFLSPLPFLERFIRLLNYFTSLPSSPNLPASTSDQDRALRLPEAVPTKRTADPQCGDLLFPIAVDLLKFIHSRGDLLLTQSPSLIAATVLALSHRLLLASQSQIAAPHRCLQTQNIWSPQMAEITGIRSEEFDKT